MEPGDGVGGVDEIPWLPGETRPADPADSVLQGPMELMGVFHSLNMVLGFFALHLRGRRQWYYLAGEWILGYRREEGDRLDRVDFDISRKLQFICVGADTTFNWKRVELLPVQLSGRPGCLDEMGIKPYLITGFESWGGAPSFVICLGMPVLGCGHLGLDQGVDLLQVGGCLVSAHLLWIFYWSV